MLSFKREKLSVVCVLLVSVTGMFLLGCKGEKASDPNTPQPQTQQKPTTPAETNVLANQQPANPKPTVESIIARATAWDPTYRNWYGKAAPNFTVTDLNGQSHNLSDYKGKKVVLVFWATWCPPCKLEIPHLIELRKSVGEQDVAILAVSNEKLETVQKFMALAPGMNYTILLEKGDLPAPFGVNRIYSSTGIPAAFFIDAEGIIRLSTAGAVPYSDSKAILDAI